MIDIIVTSWRRYDLLDKTLESLVKFYPESKIYVREDGELTHEFKELMSKYKQVYYLCENHLGQVLSIDQLMTLVNSEYYLHTEDDFLCTGNGTKEALEILKDPLCNSVSLRGASPQAHNRHPHVDEGVLKMVKGWNGWSGWSYAPSIRRLKDYVPYSTLAKFDPKIPWEAERKIGNYFSKNGYNATTRNSYFVHIGANNSTLHFQ